MSSTGVPSIASSPTTSRDRSSTDSRRQIVANTVGPILSPLREDADPGRVKPIARMTRSHRNFGLGHTTKEKNDLNMRKIIQAPEAVGGKSRRIQIDPAVQGACCPQFGFSVDDAHRKLKFRLENLCKN